MKKHISLFLAFALAFSLVFSVMPVSLAAGAAGYDPNPSGAELVTLAPATVVGAEITNPDAGSVKNAFGTDPTVFSIDLVTETFTATGGKIAAYSTDGGNKWIPGDAKAINASLTKILDKGCTLVLASAYDTKTKKPTVGVDAVAKDGDTPAIANVNGASLVTFPTIDKRPSGAKLAVQYVDTGMGNSVWQIVEKGSTDPLFNDTATEQKMYQVAQSDDGKTVKAKTLWFAPRKDFVVQPLPKDGKPAKYTFLVASAPVAGDSNVPAGKPAKVSVSSQVKAVAVKVDYKKEELKLKAGMNVFFGAAPSPGTTIKPIISIDDEDYVAKSAAATVINDDDADDAVSLSDADGTFENGVYLAGKAGVDKGSATANIGAYIGSTSNVMIVWAAGSAKKPASAPVTYKLGVRADGSKLKAPSVSAGKVALDKTWQFAEPLDAESIAAGDTPTWGKASKFTAAGKKLVRQGATGKAQKINGTVIDDSKQVAAGTYRLFVWDWVNTSTTPGKTKMGVGSTWVGAKETVLDATALTTPASAPASWALELAAGKESVEKKYTVKASDKSYTIVAVVNPSTAGKKGEAAVTPNPSATPAVTAYPGVEAIAEANGTIEITVTATVGWVFDEKLAEDAAKAFLANYAPASNPVCAFTANSYSIDERTLSISVTITGTAAA